jgi:hypothetical protein
VTIFSSPDLEKVKLERIGVMPFLRGTQPGNLEETLDCKVCRLTYRPGQLIAGAEQTLTRYTQEALEDRFGEKVVNRVLMMSAYETLEVDQSRDTPRQLARRLGRTVDANLMILGTVWRYRERVGSAAGVSVPASVAFDLYLIDVASGTMLWTGNFDETQQSLSYNILDVGTFFKRGVRWLTVNQLGRYGVQELVKELPLS